jgi:hypothetical protein
MPANGPLPWLSSRRRAASLARGKSFSSTAGELFFPLVNGETIPHLEKHPIARDVFRLVMKSTGQFAAGQ